MVDTVALALCRCVTSVSHVCENNGANQQSDGRGARGDITFLSSFAEHNLFMSYEL